METTWPLPRHGRLALVFSCILYILNILYASLCPRRTLFRLKYKYNKKSTLNSFLFVVRIFFIGSANNFSTDTLLSLIKIKTKGHNLHKFDFVLKLEKYFCNVRSVLLISTLESFKWSTRLENVQGWNGKPGFLLNNTREWIAVDRNYINSAGKESVGSKQNSKIRADWTTAQVLKCIEGRRFTFRTWNLLGQSYSLVLTKVHLFTASWTQGHLSSNETKNCSHTTLCSYKHDSCSHDILLCDRIRKISLNNFNLIGQWTRNVTYFRANFP